MAKYEVEITKVFGLAITKKVLVEAEDMGGAIDEAKNADWKPVYESITPSNMSQSYEIAEIVVNGETVESTNLNDHLLDEAIELNRETHQS